MRTIVVAGLLAICVVGAAFAQGAPSNQGAKVYFINLADGDAVTSPLGILFGLSGMGIAPAGVEMEGAGHHHLLVDRPPLGQGEDGADELLYSIPTDDNHRHFGGGQTETVLKLAPGAHTLQLVLGDYAHAPHSPPVMSEVVTVTAK